ASFPPRVGRLPCKVPCSGGAKHPVRIQGFLGLAAPEMPGSGRRNMPELATVLSEDLDSTTVVTVRGEIDVSNRDEIHTGILGAGSLNTRCLLLDLSVVGYSDSVGGRLAFDLEQRLSRQAIAFGVARPADSYVRKVLEMCGAEQL